MAKTTTGNLIPSRVNTPLDARTRIATLADAANIENPMLGGIFYCIATGKHYRITALKSKTIGALTVENAAVDTYEAIPDASDLSTVNSAIGNFETQANAIIGEEESE